MYVLKKFLKRKIVNKKLIIIKEITGNHVSFKNYYQKLNSKRRFLNYSQIIIYNQLIHYRRRR